MALTTAIKRVLNRVLAPANLEAIWPSYWLQQTWPELDALLPHQRPSRPEPWLSVPSSGPAQESPRA